MVDVTPGLSGLKFWAVKRVNVEKRKCYHESFTEEKCVALGTQDTSSKSQFCILNLCAVVPRLPDDTLVPVLTLV